MNDTAQMLDAAIQTLDESAAHANRQRHALALQVGRLSGAMKLVLLTLDAAEIRDSDARRYVDEAIRMLRLALDTEGE